MTRIGRMICYQEYNVKSPLNALAAKWVEQNLNLLPVDTRNVAPPSECQQPVVATEETPAANATPESVPVAQPEDPWPQKISIS